MQAQALFLGRHFRRAFHLLNASHVVLRDLCFRYHAAKCLEELKEWDQCLQMLGDAKLDEHSNVCDTKGESVMYLEKDAQDHKINVQESKQFGGLRKHWLMAASMNSTWEPTIVNLAYAYRKLKIYPEAIKYYEKALNLSTKSLSTYSGLAYTYHLKEDYIAAITNYHKALWLKPDDQFCTEMLTLALAEGEPL